MADVPPDFRLHPLQRKTPPWRATLVAQAFLCIGLYLAFRVGAPHEAVRKSGGFRSDQGAPRGINDIHFLSVAGGPRPIDQQMQLLRLMNTATRIYDAKFVVCVTEFGDDDALLLNATLGFEALRIPWFTTAVALKQDKPYFLKQFQISDGKVLDVIVLDTRSWKVDKKAATDNQQYNWLTRPLVSTNGTWHVVVGLHPLAKCGCDQATSKKSGAYSHLSGLFLKLGVNLYISKQYCSTMSGSTSGVPYISNPSHANNKFEAFSGKQDDEIDRILVDGFHLHRVSLLEIETYFINFAGDVTSRHLVQHSGRASV